MNHDPTPTSPADHNPSPDDHGDNNDGIADGQRRHRHQHRRQDQQPHGNAAADAMPSSSSPNSFPLSRQAKEGLMKKQSFLLNLLQHLDTLILAELCAMYYMDCSLFRLFIRWLPQWAYLSPKPDNIIFLLPSYHVGAILGPNLACLFLHLVTSLPQASEASRGYLHGGVLVDFVGQRPPTSKLAFVLLDVLLLGLQCFMLAVRMEKDRVKKIIKPPRGPISNASSGHSTDTMALVDQDLNAEERGVLRDAAMAEDADEIELQPLRQAGCRRAEDEMGGERPSVGYRGATARRNRVYEDLRDVLDSGNAILADFHVRHALHQAWDDRLSTTENAAALALQGVGYNATLAALAAQRRARLATGSANAPRG